MSVFLASRVVVVRSPAARIIHFPESAGGNKGAGRLKRFMASDLGGSLRQRADGLIRALRGMKGKRVTGYCRGNGFQYEAEALMQAVDAGATESDLMPLDESLEIMTVIDKARTAWQKESQI